MIDLFSLYLFDGNVASARLQFDVGGVRCFLCDLIIEYLHRKKLPTCRVVRQMWVQSWSGVLVENCCSVTEVYELYCCGTVRLQSVPVGLKVVTYIRHTEVLQARSFRNVPARNGPSR